VDGEGLETLHNRLRLVHEEPLQVLRSLRSEPRLSEVAIAGQAPAQEGFLPEDMRTQLAQRIAAMDGVCRPDAAWPVPAALRSGNAALGRGLRSG